MLAASKSRKDRLAALRAKKAAAAGRASGSAGSAAKATNSGADSSESDLAASRKRQRAPASTQPSRTLKFRNYTPGPETSSVAAPVTIHPPSEIVGERVAGAVADAMAPRDPTAPIVIVQKKIDWDLKRDVAPQLDILEKRTRIAIRELLRKQLIGSAPK